MEPQTGIRRLGEHTGSLLRRREIAGLHCTELVHPAGLLVERHSHQSAYLCLLLQGAYDDIHHGGNEVRASPSLFVQPGGVIHSNQIHQQGARDMAIEFDGQWLHWLGPCARALEHPVSFHQGPVLSTALQMYAELPFDDTAATLSLQGLALELVASIARAPAVDEGHPQWLQELLESLHDNPGERFELQRLAARAQVHPVHLSRTFRRRMGCSLGTYLRRLRVRAACDQLRRSFDSIAAIAARLGFYDEPHLDRLFKRVMGVTPGAYRRIHHRR